MKVTHRLLGPMAIIAAFCTTAFTTPTLGAENEVNVYSARKEALIKPLLDQFSAESGVKVNLVTASGDALLTRLKSEGDNSPADLLITTDAGRLYRAQEAGVLQTVASDALAAAIPEHLRSPEGYWYGNVDEDSLEDILNALEEGQPAEEHLIAGAIA